MNLSPLLLPVISVLATLSYIIKTIEAFLGISTRLVVLIDGLDVCEQQRILQILDVRTLSSAFSFSYSVQCRWLLAASARAPLQRERSIHHLDRLRSAQDDAGHDILSCRLAHVHVHRPAPSHWLRYDGERPRLSPLDHSTPDLLATESESNEATEEERRWLSEATTARALNATHCCRERERESSVVCF